MSFDIDGKTHTLQGICNDYPQVDNKRMEVIKWCKNKDKDKSGAMLYMEMP